MFGVFFHLTKSAVCRSYLIYGCKPYYLLELADVEVSNFDISRSRIGDNLPITCDVDTCASNVMVQLLRGDTVVNMSTISNPAAGTTSFNPLISQGFSGEYSCSVMGSHNEMEFTVTQAFNVTGTI